MDATELLQNGERLDDLQYKGLRVIQNPAAFCFGTDAVLLANFATVRKGDTVVDLGTGSGVIALLIAARSEAGRLVGVEIQPGIADMARRSVVLNALESRIEIRNIDLKNAPRELGHGIAEVIVCNPPYGKADAGLHSESEAHRIARHEVACTLEDCVRSASALLKNGGRAAFIHQSDRLVELVGLLQKHRLEPKRIRAVQHTADRPPNLLLIEGVKNGKSGIVWLPTLVLRTAGGEYSEELRQIYHME